MLYIVSTPIGNLEDITLRALKTLFSVPLIVAEDTRRTGTLMDYYRRTPILDNIFANQPETRIDKPKFISLNDHNEKHRIPQLIAHLQNQPAALVSDAGTPLVADPGFKLVRACLKANIKVVPIPGPVAWIAGLVASGMPTNHFTFVGYLPNRQNRRRKFLRQLQEAHSQLKSPPAVACYEAPHRLLTTLTDIHHIMGNIDLALAKEITKLHEKIATKPVSLWIADLNKLKTIKGEYTILFQLPKSSVETDIDEEE